jgi:IPT/TIG domain
MSNQTSNPRIFCIFEFRRGFQKKAINRNLLFGMIVFLFFSSCKKNEVTNTPPPPPPTQVVTVKSVKPPKANPGDTVTIIGTNFSLTPSKDTVKFNGISAQVIKAGEDTLYVIVPVGNASGIVAVNGIIDSGFLFAVNIPAALSITSVKPAWGKQGDTILIIGTTFNTNPAKDTVTINGVSAVVQSATADSLHVVVPQTSSGNIKVNGILAPAPGFIYGPTVIVTTVVGGTPQGVGYKDGPDSVAKFNQITGLCFDKQGNLFIADHVNYVIREISAGFVSTPLLNNYDVNGYGPISGQPYGGPVAGIVIDPQGNFYITDNPYPVNLSQYAGNYSPSGGGLLVKISNDTAYAEWATGFYSPGPVAVDSKGNIFVGDVGVIHKITASGEVSIFAGKEPDMQSYFNQVPEWVLYNGYEDGQDTAARFGVISGFAIDAADNIYVVDMGCECIRKVTSSGLVSHFALPVNNNPNFGHGAYALPYNGPIGICIDATTGNLYATEGNSIVKITPDGVVTTIVGSATAGSADGPPGIAQFYYPNAIALDAQGNLYVSNSGNGSIRKITFY